MLLSRVVNGMLFGTFIFFAKMLLVLRMQICGLHLVMHHCTKNEVFH